MDKELQILLRLFQLERAQKVSVWPARFPRQVVHMSDGDIETTEPVYPLLDALQQGLCRYLVSDESLETEDLTNLVAFVGELRTNTPPEKLESHEHLHWSTLASYISETAIAEHWQLPDITREDCEAVLRAWI